MNTRETTVLFHSWIHAGILISTVSQFKDNTITEELRIPQKKCILEKIRAWLYRYETNGLIKTKPHWCVPASWLIFLIYKLDYPSKSMTDFYAEHWIKRLMLKSHSLCMIMRNTCSQQDTDQDLMSKWLLLSQSLRDLHQELSKQLTDRLILSEIQPRIIVIMHSHKKERDFTTSPQMNAHTEKRLYQHLFQVGNHPAFWRNNSQFTFHFPKSYSESIFMC